MPYLSKIPINPLRKGVPQFLENPQSIHAAILAAIPEQPVTGRTLWRSEVITDAYRKPCRVELLALTQTRPSWRGLIETHGWPDSEGGDALVRDYAPVLDAVRSGKEFSFRVRTNPSSISHQQPSASDGRGARIGHRTAGHQLDWFLDRAADGGDTWGFSVGAGDDPTATLTERGQLRFRKGARDRSHTVSLVTATFEGLLRVTDAERFREVLAQGLGRGKAYGCGLLTIARPRPSDVVAG